MSKKELCRYQTKSLNESHAYGEKVSITEEGQEENHLYRELELRSLCSNDLSGHISTLGGQCSASHHPTEELVLETITEQIQELV